MKQHELTHRSRQLNSKDEKYWESRGQPMPPHPSTTAPLPSAPADGQEQTTPPERKGQ